MLVRVQSVHDGRGAGCGGRGQGAGVWCGRAARGRHGQSACLIQSRHQPRGTWQPRRTRQGS